MGRLSAVVAAIGLGAGACASAATVSVTVKDSSGKPVSDAVIVLAPASAAAHARGGPATKIIDQKEETFIPYVEVFHPGDRVVFRNSDTTRHHVYSFSPVGAFEFVLAPSESSPPFTLDRPGAISAGCNIHDRMITHLYVTDAPFVARSADGRVEFDGVPEGEYVARAWHPQLRGKLADRKLRVGEAGAAAGFELSLFPDPRGSASRERSGY